MRVLLPTAVTTALFLALFTILAYSNPAGAQARCLPREDAVKRLTEQFGEAQMLTAITGNGAVLEIFASAEGKTWTALVTMPDGTSCLVSYGESMTVMPLPEPGRGS